MRLLLFIPLLLFISCKKDKVPAPEVCTGVAMTGDRELFVGKWRWYNTRVEEWFDVGPSNYYNYTPQNQGFEYYFTISQDGYYKGYRNEILIHDFVMSEILFEAYNTTTVDAIKFSTNCTNNSFGFSHLVFNLTKDSIFTSTYPLDFDDLENHLKSHQNYFVKE